MQTIKNPIGITTSVRKNVKQKFKFQHSGSIKSHIRPEPFDRQLPGTRDPSKPNYNAQLPTKIKGLTVFPRFHNPHHVRLLNKWSKEVGPMPPTPRDRGRIEKLVGMSDTRMIRPEG